MTAEQREALARMLTESGPAIGSLQHLLHALATGRYPLQPEAETQRAVEERLRENLPVGIEVKREHFLGPGDRPDFFLPGAGIAIEIKVMGSSATAIYRQLRRYALHDSVNTLILVTGKSMGLPPEIEGKPAYYVSLSRSWL